MPARCRVHPARSVCASSLPSVAVLASLCPAHLSACAASLRAHAACRHIPPFLVSPTSLRVPILTLSPYWTPVGVGLRAFHISRPLPHRLRTVFRFSCAPPSFFRLPTVHGSDRVFFAVARLNRHSHACRGPVSFLCVFHSGASLPAVARVHLFTALAFAHPPVSPHRSVALV